MAASSDVHIAGYQEVAVDDLVGEIDIDKMEAGREMDALVAEQVMGWTGCVESVGAERNTKTTQELGSNVIACRPPKSKRNRPLPRYSTDIASAFEVLEHFDAWQLERDSVHNSLTCTVHQYSVGDRDGWGSSTSAPLVICRAALKAVVKQPD